MSSHTNSSCEIADLFYEKFKKTTISYARQDIRCLTGHVDPSSTNHLFCGVFFCWLGTRYIRGLYVRTIH